MNRIDQFTDQASRLLFFAVEDKKHSLAVEEWVASLPENLTPLQQNQAYAALDLIDTHLGRKTKRLFSIFMAKAKKERMRKAMDLIQEAKTRLSYDSSLTSEVEARLKFYGNTAHRLGIKRAAEHDALSIKVMSAKFWEHAKNYSEYEKYMRLFFQGEHMLIEENETYALYDCLRVARRGAYLRGSSHYDHGTINGKTGGPPPMNKTITAVANPQYAITGPQIKSLLFGRVKLAVDEKDNPLFGKTFEQSCQEAGKKKKEAPKRFKQYTFVQTEWAPDSDTIYSKNFWKHRVFSFFLYKCRKLFHFEKPNVGPYGYGHADKGYNAKSNPTLIRLKPL
ncbi:hypothetical protein [Parachlamydia acanthamoebae]|uniref:hypothetical protein n=1 Tax=Parachlamydia acanthamoebae TaxID=83552 RepID=UPI0007519D7F|nr:hypothetical protein [Parachlamydia acanthamoebae]